ncbi:MAG: transcription termination factor NusA, partial [Neoaquamicrobium sediminum]
KDGETKMFEGVLSPFGVTRADAEQMVVAARLKAGWITEDDLASEEEATAEGEAQDETQGA